MKIQIVASKNGQYFWRIKGRNGKIMAHSETYTKESNARAGADRVLQESFMGNMWVEEKTVK